MTRSIEEAARAAQDSAAAVGPRIESVRLLGYSGGEQAAGALKALLDPQEPEAAQLAAIAALSQAAHAPTLPSA